MDLKSFVIGAACGGVLYAGISTVLTDRSSTARPEGGETVIGRNADLPSTAGMDRSSDSSAAAGEATGNGNPGNSISSEPSSIPRAGTQPPTSNDSSQQPVNSASSSGQSAARATESPSQQRNWLDNRRSEIMNEPKNDSWAYFMEQAMLEYLTNHSAMPEFSLEYIECRSTVCQISIAGYDESTGPTWQRVMYDMRQQPWYEFGQVGSTSGEADGRFMTITELHRLSE